MFRDGINANGQMQFEGGIDQFAGESLFFDGAIPQTEIINEDLLKQVDETLVIRNIFDEKTPYIMYKNPEKVTENGETIDSLMCICFKKYRAAMFFYFFVNGNAKNANDRAIMQTVEGGKVFKVYLPNNGKELSYVENLLVYKNSNAKQIAFEIMEKTIERFSDKLPQEFLDSAWELIAANIKAPGSIPPYALQFAERLYEKSIDQEIDDSEVDVVIKDEKDQETKAAPVVKTEPKVVETEVEKVAPSFSLSEWRKANNKIPAKPDRGTADWTSEDTIKASQAYTQAKKERKQGDDVKNGVAKPEVKAVIKPVEPVAPSFSLNEFRRMHNVLPVVQVINEVKLPAVPVKEEPKQPVIAEIKNPVRFVMDTTPKIENLVNVECSFEKPIAVTDKACTIKLDFNSMVEAKQFIQSLPSVRYALVQGVSTSFRGKDKTKVTDVGSVYIVEGQEAAVIGELVKLCKLDEGDNKTPVASFFKHINDKAVPVGKFFAMFGSKTKSQTIKDRLSKILLPAQLKKQLGYN